MALLKKICPNCRFQNSPNQFFCQNPEIECSTRLDQVDPVEVAPRAPPAAHSPCPHCGYSENPLGSEDCLRCGSLIGGPKRRFAIRFPFGVVAVDESLRVGRDPKFSSISADLADFNKVSRQHAEFAVVDGRLFVTDARSTNGVRVNGEVIEVEKPRSIEVGDEILLSSQLRCTIVSRE
jgi:hypothetical protein